MSEHIPEPDVNSDAGFFQALGNLTGREFEEGELEELANASGDRSVARALVEEGSAPERDDQGRFTAPETPAEEEAAPEQEEEDPDIAALLEQHGGDAAAALRALKQERDNAQSLIGRQGDELGKLRESQARLEGRVDAMSTQPQQQVSASVSPADIQNSIEQNGGEATINWLASNAPDQIDLALSTWGDVAGARLELGEPGMGAEIVKIAQMQARWENAKAVTAQQQQAAAQAPPAADEDREYIKSLREQETFNSNLSKAREGLKQDEWAAISPHLVPVLQDKENLPVLVREALVNPRSNEEHVAGLKQVIEIARARGIESALEPSKAAAATQVRETKKATALVGGSTSPVGGRRESAPEAGSSEDNIATFKDRLINEETRSVQGGLTYGKT